MGGARCCFRDCHVSFKKFPNMHFFRFPMKDADRFKKWRQFCQMERILEFPEVRRRNTSICGRHFRPECFMNYKLDRLTASAVPTIMRLSFDKAIDFELDISNGILVDLEKPKLKHLLPPDSFECPLSLINDKILHDKLKILQSQQYYTIEYIEIEPEESKDINFVRPILKRPRENVDEKNPVNSNCYKKCRILNTSHCVGGNDVKKSSKVVLASLDDGEIESNEVDIVDTFPIENQTELVNNDGQLFLTTESFSYGCDNDIKIYQVHENRNDIHNELPANDSDTTIEQIEFQIQSNDTETENEEIINVQQQLLEYDKLKQEYGTLFVKYSLLETENKELRKECQHIEEIKRNLLSTTLENNNLTESLKDLNVLKEKVHKYSEENNKLKMETDNIEVLKSELLTRKAETNELKRLLATLRNDNSLNIELENKKKEINGLIRKLDISQQQLNDTVSELKDVQTKLNNVENDNKILTKNEHDLKKSLNNIQINFDLKQNDYNILKFDFDNLQQKQSELEQECWKLEALQNQESTVSTSLPLPLASAISASSLTKAQLFNGIKRYLCASMVSLLRMEMFGSSERQWKADERQVAVDILRLGDIVYKYFIDEWRIRLPSLRDVRNWLSQSQQLMEDEEDL